MRAYMEISKTAIGLSKKIRKMGYDSSAQFIVVYPSSNQCRSWRVGCTRSLISREFGSSMRIASVLTDSPLQHDSPIDIGVMIYA